jgi:iron(III) transport system permease protein
VWVERSLRGAILTILGFLVCYPLWKLAYGSLWSETRITRPGHLTVANYIDILSDPFFLKVLLSTMLVAVGATIISVVLGVPLAWLAVRTNMPGRGLVRTVTLLPFFTSTILVAVSWALLLSPQIGLLTPMIEMFGLGTINIFSLGGVTWATGIYHTPYMYLFATAAFASIDSSLEEAAQASGAGFMRTMAQVTVPLIAPSITSAALLICISAMGLFGFAAILATPAGIYLLPSYIHRLTAVFPVQYNTAAAVSVVMIVISLVIILIQSRVAAEGKKYTTISGKSSQPRLVDLGRWRWAAAGCYAVFILVAVALPYFVLLLASLSPSWSATMSFTGLSLVHFERLFVGSMSGVVWRSMLNSLYLGVAAATSSVICCFFVAWTVQRGTGRLRLVAETLAIIPLAVPGIVFGVAFLWAWIAFPVQIYGTLWVLIIAYITRTVPHSTRVIGVSLMQISGDLEEAARATGASWARTMRGVVLPLLTPGLLAAWSFVFVLSLKELNTAILLVTPDTSVLATLVYNIYQEGSFATLSALVLVQALLAAGVLGLFELIIKRTSASARKSVPAVSLS